MKLNQNKINKLANNQSKSQSELIISIEQLKEAFRKAEEKSIAQDKVILALKILLEQKESNIRALQNISFSKFYKDKIIFPRVENPLVSIIIPVYNQYDYTKACLYTVLNTVHDIDYEIIIADDNSTDQTENILNEVENIVIAKNWINLGFLKNVNSAAKEAKGKYICLLNNDTIPKDNWLKYLLETMESKDDIGIVGAKFLATNGKLHEAGCFMSKQGIPGQYGFNQEVNDPEFNEEKEVDYCSGCGVLIKKSAWEEIGGFDEQFAPAFYEDPDLSFAFKYNLGLKTFYQPKAEIIHFHNISYQHVNDHTAHANRPKFQQKWEKELNSGNYRDLDKN